LDILNEPLVVGQSFDLEFEVENTEEGEAGQFAVKFYLSDNSFISANDFFLDTYEITTLPGNSKTGRIVYNLTLPGEGNEFWGENGIYYVGMVVDADEQIAEINENNNSNDVQFVGQDDVEVSVTPPLPDLAPNFFDVVTEPSSAGATVEIIYEVVNNSPGSSEKSTVSFYLSDNDWFSTSDKLLQTVDIPALAGNNTTEEQTINLDLPNANDPFWQGNGTYYIGMIVDAENQLEESVEDNNTNQGKFKDFDDVDISVAPELVGNYFDIINEPLNAGDSFDVEFGVKNNSGINAQAFTVSFYLSDNNWFSTEDKLLNTVEVDSLTANGSTEVQTVNLTLPGEGDSYWQGNQTYYVGMIIDINNEIQPANLGQFQDFDDVNITIL